REESRAVLQCRPDLPKARPAERRGAVLSAGADGRSAIRRSALESGPRADGDGAGGRGAVVLAEGDSREAGTGANVLRAAGGVGKSQESDCRQHRNYQAVSRYWAEAGTPELVLRSWRIAAKLPVGHRHSRFLCGKHT